MNSTPFKAGGALTAEDAAVYVERQAVQDALAHLRSMDYLVVIEPRQQGKTSLINFVMRHPSLHNTAFSYIDVSTLDPTTEIAWYQSLCQRILRQLHRIIPQTHALELPQNSVGWRDFLSKLAIIAVEAHHNVVVALDEIGSMDFAGATVFFSVLRDVYNSREVEPELKHLTFLLAGVFHPRDLISDTRISPFNIARRVRLPDFTLSQVQELVCKGKWDSEQALPLADRIHHWTNGHPYLTQLFCTYLNPDASVADVDASVDRLRRDDGNHLPPILERLNSDSQLRGYLARIRSGEQIRFYPNENRRQSQLELLGVIGADSGGYCTMRNRIYEQVFSQAVKNGLNALSDETQVSVQKPSEPNQSSAPSANDMSEAKDRELIRSQLSNARDNLRMLEERKAQYVVEVEIPLQILKEERRLRECIIDLEQRLSSN